MTQKGLIVRSTGDRMAVLAEDGKTYTCRARGKFRLDGSFPLAGDVVTFRRARGGEHLVGSIIPRKNYLIRPPVANVDKLYLVVSLAPPVTDRLAMDTLLAAAEYHGITPVIVVNKTDVTDGEPIADIYRKAGYRVFITSTVTLEGVEALREDIGEGLSVFAGSSGVGKSSLLNVTLPDVKVRTSHISERIGRGRHTTRHVELFKNGRGGYIVDTPGFSSIDPVQMLLYKKERIAACFPEFEEYLGHCRYDDCTHTIDEECAIRNAVEEGKIDPIRHQNYIAIYENVSRLKDWQIRELLKGE